ncbi:MAG: glycosyltransferase family 9 protein [Candidatus Brocadia sp.]|jgi:lipopolysaccharide heptosyltransferase II
MKKILKRLLSLFCGAVSLCSGKKPIKKNLVKNILVFRTGGIGDIVRIFPAMESLHANFPLASISVLAFPYVKKTFELFPERSVIQEIIDYDPEGMHNNLLKRLSLALSLRKKKYDLVYMPDTGEGTDGTILMTFFTGATNRIGFAEDRGSFLNTVNIKFRKDIPIITQTLSLLEAAGLAVVSKKIRLNISEKELAFARILLNGTNDSLPFISLHPGVVSNARYRSWPVENYINLIREIIKEIPAKVIIIGGTGEREIGEMISAELGNDAVINLIGKTSIPQMAALIKLSCLFIGGDSGPLHIAESADTPFVGIFGPTSPAQVLSCPSNTSKIIVRSNLPCSPCYLHSGAFLPPCGGTIECLRKVSVKMVADAVKQLFITIRKGDFILCE